MFIYAYFDNIVISKFTFNCHLGVIVTLQMNVTAFVAPVRSRAHKLEFYCPELFPIQFPNYYFRTSVSENGPVKTTIPQQDETAIKNKPTCCYSVNKLPRRAFVKRMDAVSFLRSGLVSGCVIGDFMWCE